MNKTEWKKINEAIVFLSSLKMKTLKDFEEIVSVYNTDGEGYVDFYYGIPDTDYCIEGCFCGDGYGSFSLSDSFTVLDMEQNVIIE